MDTTAIGVGVVIGLLLPFAPTFLPRYRNKCACDHIRSMHDRETGACNDTDLIEINGTDELVPCGCQWYDGPGRWLAFSYRKQKENG